jgi:hypothetical protein
LRTVELLHSGSTRVEVLVAPPTQQQGLGAQRLVELDLGPLLAVFVPNLVEPAAVPEALLAGGVLDDSVERDVLAHDDLSHFGSPSFALSVTTDVDTATSKKWAPANRPVRPSAGGYTRWKRDKVRWG